MHTVKTALVSAQIAWILADTPVLRQSVRTMAAKSQKIILYVSASLITQEFVLLISRIAHFQKVVARIACLDCKHDTMLFLTRVKIVYVACMIAIASMANVVTFSEHVLSNASTLATLFCSANYLSHFIDQLHI